ncbi:MAG: ABC transporter permease [Leifsonia sp.]
MLALIARRLLISIPLLLVTSLITFVLQALIPGDAARAIVGANGSVEAYERIRDQLHLNQPVLQQYWEYLTGVLHGDLGTSLFTGAPVLSTLLERIPATLSVVLVAVIICSVVGVALGLAGSRRQGPISRTLEGLSVIGLALPNFWVALILVALFAIAIPLFPATGYVPLTVSASGWLSALVLPAVALSLAGIANLAKTTRVTVADVMRQDYIRNLRACGVGERSLLWRHGLRNAGVPILTLVGLYAVGAITGSLFIENVFALPGLGALLSTATDNHDVPVIQGVALAYAVIVVVFNLATDVLSALINPKLRMS